MLSCTIATNATCLMQLTLYVYDELQVAIVIRKCGCKPNYKTSIFFILLENDGLKASDIRVKT
jgi:hypothetical protein